MEEYFTLLIQVLPSLLEGLKLTILIAICALFFATVLGLLFGLASISKNKILNRIANLYVGLIRGIPVFVLAYFFYFGICGSIGLKVSPFVASVIVLSINASAFLCEIFRGGILAVDFGQMEAARSLGIPYRKSMIHVILPQAIKIMVPSIMNQFITTLKDTSILSVITVRELMMNSQIIVSRNFLPFQIYSYTVVFYIVIVSVLTFVSKKLEKRLNYDSRG
jgi:polar amino acid transport system permease protein/polar amino acid transport system substrate-binding protein